MRVLRFALRWSMFEVFLIGVLIAVVRSAGVNYARRLSGLGIGPRWIGKGVEARREVQTGSTPGESMQKPHPPPFRSNPKGRGDFRRHLLLPARCVGPAELSHLGVTDA